MKALVSKDPVAVARVLKKELYAHNVELKKLQEQEEVMVIR